MEKKDVEKMILLLEGINNNTKKLNTSIEALNSNLITLGQKVIINHKETNFALESIIANIKKLIH